MKPRALILRTAGTNCDVETAYAFELAGAGAVSLHINRLLENAGQLAHFQMLAIPGGFSYGDDIAAGRIFANQLTQHLREPLREFVAAGKPVIGVCNGFQVLIKTELLPGPLAGLTGQTCTLAHNAGGRFIDRWIHVAPRSKKCIWTAGLAPLELPIAHGEGKFVALNNVLAAELRTSDQIALTYCRPDGTPANGTPPHNPNGSTDDIAGICDQTGLVFGLMPHPERHVSRLQHPAWTSKSDQSDNGAGLHIFRNAVRHVNDAVGAGV